MSAKQIVSSGFSLWFSGAVADQLRLKKKKKTLSLQGTVLTLYTTLFSI
jgi:hypothetical protein